eukprot:scaffold104709_cov18-Prasinocladus_malaysianus.AAC.1
MGVTSPKHTQIAYVGCLHAIHVLPWYCRILKCTQLFSPTHDVFDFMSHHHREGPVSASDSVMSLSLSYSTGLACRCYRFDTCNQLLFFMPKFSWAFCVAPVITPLRSQVSGRTQIVIVVASSLVCNAKAIHGAQQTTIC